MDGGLWLAWRTTTPGEDEATKRHRVDSCVVHRPPAHLVGLVARTVLYGAVGKNKKEEECFRDPSLPGSACLFSRRIGN
jgi:hypothetical protein